MSSGPITCHPSPGPVMTQRHLSYKPIHTYVNKNKKQKYINGPERLICSGPLSVILPLRCDATSFVGGGAGLYIKSKILLKKLVSIKKNVKEIQRILTYGPK
jgi:hypothetical protein